MTTPYQVPITLATICESFFFFSTQVHKVGLRYGVEKILIQDLNNNFQDSYQPNQLAPTTICGQLYLTNCKKNKCTSPLFTHLNLWTIRPPSGNP